MTSPPAPALNTSPWLSVWMRPRTTIAAILASDSRRHVLLLAALYLMADFASRLVSVESAIAFLNWRIIAVAVPAAIGLGIALLYLLAFVFQWTGRILGGQAPLVHLRAALAWGFVPCIAILPVAGIAFLVQSIAGNGPARGATVVLQVIVVALGLWSFVVTVLMLGRVQGFGFWRAIASSVLGYAVLVLMALLFRTLLFQPFNTPSGSMKPTLLIGDYVFVSKFAYGYTHYSLPWSPPLFSGRVFASEPRCGDLVVFRLPRDPSTDYIKRVVGLPGDRVQMIAGILQINGSPIKHEQMEELVEMNEDGRTTRAKRWRETLPNGVTFTTLDMVDNGFLDNTPVYDVPAGHYFVLGDNLDNSQDSRVQSAVGYIPFENLVGRVAIIYFSTDRESDPKQPTVRFGRIGMRVQ